MGFLKNLFFKEDKKPTKIEKELSENIKKGADYSCATEQNIVKCNGCSQDIEGVPRILKNGGKIYYFHKRCYKAMSRGELPKPKLVEENQNGSS